MIRVPSRPLVVVGLGLLSWIVPLLISIPLVGRDGEPTIDVIAFKTVMLIVGVSTWGLLLAYYVPQLGGNYVTGALTAGVVWFGINVVLDLVVLVAIFGTPVNEWAVETGARYILILILAGTVGYVAATV